MTTTANEIVVQSTVSHDVEALVQAAVSVLTNDMQIATHEVHSTVGDQGTVQLLVDTANNSNIQDRLYMCTDCNLAFYGETGEQEWQWHLKQHKPFKCDLCSEGFEHKESLKTHMRSHTMQMPFICDKCGSAYTLKSNLVQHMKTHDDTVYQCGECKVLFKSQMNLDKHMKFHTGDTIKVYQCEQCSKTFSQQKNLVQHMKIHMSGDKPYKCSECPASYSYKCHLTRHLMIHTGDKPYKCKFCGKSFNRNAHLIRHRKIHSGGEKEWKCNQCGFAFWEKSDLFRHIRSHEDLYLYRCEVCGKSFRQYASLCAHRHRTHGNKRRTDWKCELCGTTLTKKIHLLQHVRNIHKGEGLLPCQHCDKSFLYKEDVALHACWKHGSFDCAQSEIGTNKSKRTDVTEGVFTTDIENDNDDEAPPDTENSAVKKSRLPHTCEICNLKFHYRFLLEEHMYIHTGKNAFICDKCKAEFQTKREYVRHLDEHSNEISFFCDICDKTMTTADAVHEHLEMHLGKRRYECSLCNASFPYKEQRRNHMALHDESPDFQCSICRKHLDGELEMQRHKEVFHQTKVPYTCLDCKEDFHSASNLYRHKTRVHWKADYDTKFGCEHCSGTFLSQKDLSRHRFRAHPPKPYSCMLCKGKFSNMQSLISHFKRQHEGKRITEGKTYSISEYVLKTDARDEADLEQVQEVKEMVISTVEGEDGDTAIYELEPEVFDQDVIIEDMVDIDDHQFDMDEDTSGSTDKLLFDKNQYDIYRSGSCEDSVEIKLEPCRPKGLNKKVKPYKCLICNKKVSEMRYLMIHFKESHEEERLVEGETYSIAEDQLQSISKIMRQAYGKTRKKKTDENVASGLDNTPTVTSLVIESVELDSGSKILGEYVHLDGKVKKEPTSNDDNEEIISIEPLVADEFQAHGSGLGESFVDDISGGHGTEIETITYDSTIRENMVEKETQAKQMMGLKLKTKSQSYYQSGLLFVKSQDGRLKINRKKKPSP